MVKTTRMIELGTISSRGQIAIPAKIRRVLEFSEGERVLFFLEGSVLIMKRIADTRTFSELTEPLRKAQKKINEDEIVELVHRFRKEKFERKK